MGIGKKISQLPELEVANGKELLPFAHAGLNGSVSIDTIKEYIQANSNGGDHECNLNYRLYEDTDYTVFDQQAKVSVIKENVPEISVL